MIKKNIVFLIFCFFTFSISAKSKIVDQVVAIVNDNVILKTNVDEMIDNVKKTVDASKLPSDKELYNQIIERLVIQNLIIQKAAAKNILVTEEELDSIIENIAKENNLTVDELRGQLSQAGLSYANYREKIKNEVLIEKTRVNEIRPRIVISDKEISDLVNTMNNRSENDEINISHILISIPEQASSKQIEQITEKANAIFIRLKAGENFSKLAVSYSQDDNALNGGEMGWHHLTSLPSIFEENLKNAKKGDIIGPLRSGVGFHIIKVNGIKSEEIKRVKIEEVHAKHILIKTNVLIDDEAAKNKLNEVYESIVTGENTFESAAKIYSEDVGSAMEGGDLGWNSPDIYDPGFRDAVLNLSKGQLSKPIKSQFGWHLIKLIDAREVDKTDEMQKEQAYRLIFSRKFADELQAWINELRGDAYIEILSE